MGRVVSAAGTVLLFLAVCNPTWGGTAPAAEKCFDLRQAVEFALRNNGDLDALRKEKGAREAGKVKAGLYPNPVLDIEGTTGKLSGSPSENRLSVGISQEFPTMGKRGKRLLVAERDIESFDRRIDNVGRLLAEEVKTTFYDLLLAEKRVALAARSIALTSQLLDIAKQRLDAGDIPELEVNLARVEVARSEGRRIETERELYPARARLFSLLGLHPDVEGCFSGSLEGRSFVGTLAELKGLALAQRPDVRALAAEKARCDAETALAHAERIPNITAGIGYQREETSMEVGGVEGRSRDNLIALRLSIPIPLFDRNQAGIMEAQARRASAENRYVFARQVVEREVEAAFARLTTAEKSLSIYTRDIIPQLEENLKLVQEAYRLGEVGILTVIEEQRKFFEVHDAYLLALYNRQTALVKLEAVVGADLNMEITGGAQ